MRWFGWKVFNAFALHTSNLYALARGDMHLMTSCIPCIILVN